MSRLKKSPPSLANANQPRKSTVAVALAALLFTQCAFAQQADPNSQGKDEDGPVKLKMDGKARIRPKQIPEGDATYINADKLYGNGDQETFLEGNVQIKRKDVQINSDSVTYSPITDEAKAKGNVVVQQPGIVLKAPSASVKLGSKETELNQPTFELEKIHGSGKASKALFDGIDTLTLENPDYTVCKVPSPSQADKGDWYIKADRLELDQGDEVGRATGATVVFKDTPILKAPYLSFPTTDRRKSGFLAPSFGTVSNSGAELTLPYYWNIAPDKDMTLYPKIITGRGFQLGTQTRYMTQNNLSELKYDFLPNDNKTSTNRYALSLQDTYRKGDYSAGLNVNKVSDDNYFVDFSRSQAVASQRVLLREGFLGYDAGPWRSNVRVVRQQTLQLQNDIIVAPYDRLPELNVAMSPTRYGDTFVSAVGQFTDFANPGSNTTRVAGSRAVSRASVFMPINRSAFSFTPKLSVQATSYNLTNQAPGFDSHPSSIIPTASLDSTVYFDRKTTFFGQEVNQTLEPRLYYLYTPYKDQSAQPLFDTSVSDQTFSRIFSENRYSGYDRVGDANQVTLAVTSRFNRVNTGEELFSAAIGQRLYLKSPQVILPTVESPLNNKSDFFITGRGKITRDITLDATSQISPSTGQQQRGNINVSYGPSIGKQLNAGYRYTRGQINQFDVSGQWPVSNRWSAVGRVNYSVLESRLIEGVAGLEYSPGCWAARVVLQRFATAPSLQTTSIFLQLELTGLGRLGSNPLDLLSRTVPGYTPFSGNFNPQ